MFDLDHAPQELQAEAKRHLALSSHFFGKHEWAKTLQYSRLPASGGDVEGIITHLGALVAFRKFEAAAEFASLALIGNIHPTVRKGVLDSVVPALYYLGARDGDMASAYAMTHELAGYANVNPEMPRWTGQSLNGKSLLLTLSQGGLGGFGDYLMWARFVPFVAALGARIVVQCPPPLTRLLMTLPGVIASCGFEEKSVCDYAVSLMEVPHVLGIRSIPHNQPFNISPLPMPGDTFKVGINWGASWVAPHMDRTCSLSEYLPLSKIPGVTLYSFQKGPHAKQLTPPPEGLVVQDIAHNLKDFADTATMLMSMDAVVSTDNVVANLACMLGKSAFVLVPTMGDFRWGEGKTSPWYPSARVYRQEAQGDWGECIANATADLAAFLASKTDPAVQTRKRSKQSKEGLDA